jgi:hypothetical protein
MHTETLRTEDRYISSRNILPPATEDLGSSMIQHQKMTLSGRRIDVDLRSHHSVYSKTIAKDLLLKEQKGIDVSATFATVPASNFTIRIIYLSSLT